MIIYPTGHLLEVLRNQALVVPPEGFLIDDQEYQEFLDDIKRTHSYESAEEQKFRAAYHVIWIHYGIPQDGTERGVDVTNARRIQELHQSHRELNNLHFPAMKAELDNLCHCSHKSNEWLEHIEGELGWLRKDLRDEGLTTRLYVESARQQMSVQVIRALKPAVKWVAAWAGLVLAALIVIAVFSVLGHAQIDCITLKQSGTTKGTSCAPFKMDFTGCTVTKTAATYAISCAGGTNNPGGTNNQVQLNSGGTAFGAVADGASVGQVLMFNGAGNAPTYGDPIVSGPTAQGAAPTTNPVWVSGWDGTNIRALKLWDIDTGAGTDYAQGINLRISGAGGSVEAKGQAAMAGSIPVAIASDQSAVPVSGTFWQATQPVSGTITANAGTGTFTVGQATGTNLHIVCDSGCGGAASFADSSAFTFSTTAVNNVSGVVDDVATNTVAENSAGALRMNTNRILYVDLSKTAANTTAIKVDGSAVTQPVSGTLTANIGTSGSLALDASVTGLQVAQGSTTAGQKGELMQGAVTTAAPTYTTAQTNPLSLTTAGALRVDNSANTQPVSGTVTANAGTGTFNIQANASVNIAQVAGSTTATAATGVQKVGITGNAGAAVDAATGAAPPANAILAGGLTSGATGGLVTAIPVCDSYVAVNISTITTTLVVTGVSGRQVRICSLHLITAGANNVAVIEGTGATCGTGSAGMAGGTTAATGYNLAANGGIAMGNGLGTLMRTATAGDSVCIVTSAAVQLSGGISYAIY